MFTEEFKNKLNKLTNNNKQAGMRSLANSYDQRVDLSTKVSQKTKHGPCFL